MGILEFVAGSIEIRAVRRRVCVFWGEDHQHQSGRIANTTVNENCMWNNETTNKKHKAEQKSNREVNKKTVYETSNF